MGTFSCLSQLLGVICKKMKSFQLNMVDDVTHRLLPHCARRRRGHGGHTARSRRPPARAQPGDLVARVSAA